MPNICENTIQINGKKDDFDRFLKDTEDMGYEGRFNFEDEEFPTINILKAKPMPEEFNTISNGANTINGESVNLWWYRNTETGNIEKKDIFDDDEKWVAEKVPQEYLDELTDKYGNNNWHDWVYDNWGTKWVTQVALETVVENTNSFEDDIWVEFVVDSAWGPPVYLLQYIADKYNLGIGCRWWEEGGDAGWEHIHPQEHQTNERKSFMKDLILAILDELERTKKSRS